MDAFLNVVVVNGIFTWLLVLTISWLGFGAFMAITTRSYNIAFYSIFSALVHCSAILVVHAFSYKALWIPLFTLTCFLFVLVALAYLFAGKIEHLVRNPSTYTRIELSIGVNGLIGPGMAGTIYCVKYTYYLQPIFHSFHFYF